MRDDGSAAAYSGATTAPPVPLVEPRGYWHGVGERLRRDPVTVGCMFVILTIVLSAILAPYIAPMDPDRSSIANRLRPVGYGEYLLGTDQQGRDILSRIIWGGRVSLVVGIVPVLLATVAGGIAGLVAGYFGGRVNMVIMRTMDVFFAFPSILLAIAISGSLGGGLRNQLVTLTIVLIPPICRVAETASSQIRGLDFVDAARASGASTFSILRAHVLVNMISPVLVYASTLISASILLASGLSFIGLGAPPPTADWGQMLSALRQSIFVQPLVCAIPGIAILVTSVAFNVLSEGVREALDVKS